LISYVLIRTGVLSFEFIKSLLFSDNILFSYSVCTFNPSPSPATILIFLVSSRSLFYKECFAVVTPTDLALTPKNGSVTKLLEK